MSNEFLGIERADPTPTADMFVATLKAVFGALVPPVGQGIEAYVNWRSRVKQERINEFFNDIIREIEKDKIDYEFIRTDEFGDLLEEILLKVAINRSRIKREHFKKILVHTFEGNRSPELSATYLNILNESTESELFLLAQFYKAHVDEPSVFRGGPRLGFFQKSDIEDLGYNHGEYLLMVQSLVRKGLLNDQTMGRYDADSQRTIHITALGVGFYEYITCGVDRARASEAS